MKHTLFVAFITMIGVGGALTHGPFVGVAVYYLFAVLRPQFLWAWSMPTGIAWSQFVAIAALISVFLTGFGLLRGDDKPLWGYRSRVQLPWVLFFLWLLVSYVFAIDHTRAWPYLIEYLKIALMFILAIAAIRNLRQIWILYVMATVAVCYIAWEMNMLYLQFGYLSIWRRGYGGLDNNGAGLIMAMGVPMVIAAWEGTPRWWRWIYLGMVVFLVHAVLMSYSRGAMLALILATPLIGVLSRQRKRFGVLALAVLMMLPILAGQEIRQRFFSLQQYEEDGSAQSRLNSWAAALRIAADYPITGAGIRCSNLLSFQYGADRQGRTIHSQYLQIAADNGFVGAGIYLSGLAAFFWTTLTARVRLRGRTDPDAVTTIAVANGVLGSMAVFCAGALFLSLELFELPFLLILLGGQLSVFVRLGALATTASGPEPSAPVAPQQPWSWVPSQEARS